MALSDSKKMTLKLLIDVGNNKVLFAESGKDFVDFMFSLLLLPLGSVIKLVAPRTTLGSIGKLYQSVENINETYLVANLNKSTLLQPTVSALAGASPLIRYARVPSSSCEGDFVRPKCDRTPRQIRKKGKQKQGGITRSDGGQLVRAPCSVRINKFPLDLLTGTVGTVGTPLPKNTYFCTYCQYEVFISDRYTCKNCNQIIDCTSGYSVNYGAGIGGDSVEGFVKGVVTYMITDDLEVTPMSAISSFTLINRFSVKKDVRLEEKAVVVGMEEGLALLEASLKSATALTDVFLNSSTEKAASS